MTTATAGTCIGRSHARLDSLDVIDAIYNEAMWSPRTVQALFAAGVLGVGDRLRLLRNRLLDCCGETRLADEAKLLNLDANGIHLRLNPLPSFSQEVRLIFAIDIFERIGRGNLVQ